MVGAGTCILSRIKFPVSRIKDLGPCSGMNDHPGRDTDVRSRPSESTIKDLSFYISFIRIQSCIKHLGLCFGTNGHFRRDPDMISRLSKSTIEDLSFYLQRGKAAFPPPCFLENRGLEGVWAPPWGVLEGSGRLLGGSWLQEASWVFCRLLSGGSWAAQEPSWGPRWTQV